MGLALGPLRDLFPLDLCMDFILQKLFSTRHQVMQPALEIQGLCVLLMSSRTVKSLFYEHSSFNARKKRNIWLLNRVISLQFPQCLVYCIKQYIVLYPGEAHHKTHKCWEKVVTEHPFTQRLPPKVKASLTRLHRTQDTCKLVLYESEEQQSHPKRAIAPPQYPVTDAEYEITTALHERYQIC